MTQSLDYSKFFDVMDNKRELQNGDDALNVRFFKKVCEDSSIVLDNGKFVSYLADFIEIRIPNDAGIPNIICRAVVPTDKLRFARHWQIYQTSEKGETSKQTIGYPLNEWAYVDKKRCDMLENMGFETVEQIAAMSENNALAITGSLGINGLVLKTKATDFLTQRRVISDVTNQVKKAIAHEEEEEVEVPKATNDDTKQSINKQPSKGSRYSKPGSK